MYYGQLENSQLHTFDGTYLEWKDDFKYLGSWVDNSEKDISIRKAQAWRAGMLKIWKSNMSKDLKIRFFIATIESILLYIMGARAGLCQKHKKRRWMEHTLGCCEKL